MVLASECPAAAGGLPICVTIAAAVAGIVIGFLLGARVNQLHMKVQQVGKAIISLTAVFRAPPPGAGMEGMEQAEDDIDEEEDDPWKKDGEDGRDPLEDFLHTEEIEGLEDHLDLEINPVMMHNIKRVKEAQRLQQIRETLAAEGLSEDDIEARLFSGDVVGPAEAKMNPLALLISLGARASAIRVGQSADAQRKEELKRMQRNINVFLTKTLEVDTSTTQPKERKEKGGGGRMKNAMEVAKDTKRNRFGGDGLTRSLNSIKHAKGARTVFRDNKALVDKELEKVEREEEYPEISHEELKLKEPDDDEEEESGEEDESEDEKELLA